MGKVTFIAEIGINHNGRQTILLEMVRQAALSGADYAKVQLYEPKNLFSSPEEAHLIPEAERCRLSFDQFREFVYACNKWGIKPMASVFSRERTRWLSNIIGVKFDAVKVASRTAARDPLLVADLMAEYSVYLSSGMGMHESLTEFTGEVVHLHCVSKYPSLSLDYAGEIYGPNQKYQGISCHCIGHENALRAIANGARVVERHFTLDKTLPGSDHILSSTPREFAEMVRVGRGLAAL